MLATSTIMESQARVQVRKPFTAAHRPGAGLGMSSACSFMYSGGPPANASSLPYFDCPSDYAAPSADTFWAVAGLLALISQNGQNPNGAIIAVGVSTAVLEMASAIYDYVETSRCSNAKADLNRRSAAGPHSAYAVLHPTARTNVARGGWLSNGQRMQGQPHLRPRVVYGSGALGHARGWRHARRRHVFCGTRMGQRAQGGSGA